MTKTNTKVSKDSSSNNNSDSKKKESSSKTSKNSKLDRIQKIIANSGLCSRRNAEEMIEQGRVKVNGEIATIGNSADPEKDIITVDDEKLPVQKKRYIAMYKPFDYHTTTDDPYAQKKVTDILKTAGIKERLYPVGRLDRNASGLLLLTNDGAWANCIIHPSVGYKKEYEVKTKEALPKGAIKEVQDGILLKDGPVQAIIKEKSRSLYLISLKAGRHKIVKRIFKHFGIHVISLKRVRIGPYKLGKLKIGEIMELDPSKIQDDIKAAEEKKLEAKARPKIKTNRFEQLKKLHQKNIKDKNFSDQKSLMNSDKKLKQRKSRKKVSPRIDQDFTVWKKNKERDERNLKKSPSGKKEFDYDRSYNKLKARKSQAIKNKGRGVKEEKRAFNKSRKPYQERSESNSNTGAKSFAPKRPFKKETDRKDFNRVRPKENRSSSFKDSRKETDRSSFKQKRENFRSDSKPKRENFRSDSKPSFTKSNASPKKGFDMATTLKKIGKKRVKKKNKWD